MAVGVGGAETDVDGAADAVKIEPTHRFKGPSHENLAVGHEMKMGEPLVVVVDVIVGVAGAAEGDAGEGAPGVGVLVEGFGEGAAGASPHGHEVSRGEGDGGVVPATGEHVAEAAPGLGPLGNDAEGGGGADVGSSAGGDDAAVAGGGEAGAEHVVSGVIERCDLARGGIVDGGIAEGFAGGEGGGAGGGPGDDTAVGEMGEADGDKGPSGEAGPLTDLAWLSRGERERQDSEEEEPSKHRH